MPNDMSGLPKTADNVIHHRTYGPALPKLGWVPAPRYLLRRDLLLRIFEARQPGNVLEMGCGSGALLRELSSRGHTCAGVDFSRSALLVAEAMNAHDGTVRISESLVDEAHDSFDYLCAFEVLEHIEDDLGALREWSRYLKRDGTLVISVPAHPERWNAADVWAGHFRRYQREGLTKMVSEAGYHVTDVQSYGFPLANIMERLSSGVYKRQNAAQEREDFDKKKRTEESGTDRRLLARLWPFYSLPPMTYVMRVFWMLQRLSVRSDRGIGYIVIAQKK